MDIVYGPTLEDLGTYFSDLVSKAAHYAWGSPDLLNKIFKNLECTWNVFYVSFREVTLFIFLHSKDCLGLCIIYTTLLLKIAKQSIHRNCLANRACFHPIPTVFLKEYAHVLKDGPV